MTLTSDLIALGALIVAVIGVLLGRRKEAAQSAADFARVGAQLDSIKSGVDDMRVEIKTLRSQFSGLSERIAGCETTLKMTERRLERLEIEVFHEQ